ncbi:hypothetical protein C1H46_012987 [Malus baccata]|uniref:Uncharacterized protein n=1 Tax=Malus baccata TaxID=106549 RepID=A0A540MRH7_MALBA|nr:hypothetical protein C1H46_012987 [Malus baccata]
MYKSYEETNLWKIVEEVPQGVHVNFLKAERSLHGWALGISREFMRLRKQVEWKCMSLRMQATGSMLIIRTGCLGSFPLLSIEPKTWGSFSMLLISSDIPAFY